MYNNDTYLTSCSNDIKVVSINSFEIVNSFAPHCNWTNSCSWNCDNTLIASTGGDGCVRIHSNPTNNESGYELGYKGIMLELAEFSNKSSQLLASCGNDKMVILWDAASHCPLQAFEPLELSPMCLSFTNNDQYLCIGCEAKQPQSKVISIFDLALVANKKAIKQISLPNVNQIEGVAKIDASKFSKNLLACCTSGGNLYEIDIETSNARCLSSETNSNTVDMTFSHANNLLMMGAHQNGKITFYDINEKTAINTIDIHENLTCIEQTKDGKQLVVGTKSGKIIFFDMRNMEEPLKVIKAHPSAVKDLRVDNRFECFENLSNEHQEKTSEDYQIKNEANPLQQKCSNSDYHIAYGRTSVGSHSNITFHSDKSKNFYKKCKSWFTVQHKQPTMNHTCSVSPVYVKETNNDLSDVSLSGSSKNLSDSFKTCLNVSNKPYSFDMDMFLDNDDINRMENQKINFLTYLEQSIQNTISNTISNNLTSSTDFLREDIHRGLRNLHGEIISSLKKFQISQERINLLEEQVKKLKKYNKYLKKKIKQFKSQPQ